MKLHDTIAAIATPAGTGGIAVLRLSGNDAEEIADKIAAPKNKKSVMQLENRKLTLSAIHKFGHPEQLIDEALVAVMRAPHSYTGETVVEINCHGGYFAADKILGELLASGARLAEGGEFTRRAFLNGKIDLTGAEAIMDIIDSNSGLGLQNAANILDGSLAAKINALREKVIAITSHISAAADYPEEVELPERSELKHRLTEILSETDALLATFETGRILRDGITTVIAGRPNVGKSSLLNALSRSNRAIVTDIPGTTRDIIEEYIRIGGISLRLLDTAGIRSGADIVEQIGIERTFEHISSADLCLLIIDSTEGITKEDLEISKHMHEKPTLVLLNKTDLPSNITVSEAAKALNLPESNILETSAPPKGTPQGIESLESAISEMFLNGGINPQQVYLSNARQRDSLLKARDALLSGLNGFEAGMPIDLLYVDLEDVLSALGEITGLTVREEIIENVFSRFCVGK